MRNVAYRECFTAGFTLTHDRTSIYIKDEHLPSFYTFVSHDCLAYAAVGPS
jgi:hypothetical protein